MAMERQHSQERAEIGQTIGDLSQTLEAMTLEVKSVRRSPGQCEASVASARRSAALPLRRSAAIDRTLRIGLVPLAVVIFLTSLRNAGSCFPNAHLEHEVAPVDRKYFSRSPNRRMAFARSWIFAEKSG
jgi:hypothetical protein